MAEVAIGHANGKPSQSRAKFQAEGVGFFVLLFLILAATALVYWPGLNGGFVFDDIPNIVGNGKLHVTSTRWSDWLGAMFSSPASSLQRPLAMLTFAVNHYFTGLDPRPMKLTNVAIHLLNTLLLFGLVRALVHAAMARPSPPSLPSKRLQDLAAAFVTACWSFHPINLMAVLFIVQRMESLSHTFVFAGLWLYVAGRQRQRAGRHGWPWVLAGLIPCTGLGLFAKESAVLLPLYAFATELFVFRFRIGDGAKPDRYFYLLYAVILGLPAVFAASWLLPAALGPGAFAGRDFNLGERLLTEARVVFDYLRWTVLPELGQLSLYHDDYSISHGLLRPASTLFAMVALAALLAIAWLCRARRPLMGLGIFWFFSAQVLTATVIPLELMFEHRNYFASVGICLGLANLLILAPQAKFPRRVGGTLAGFFLLFCLVTTYLRASEWSHPVRFARSEAAKHPGSPRATYELARTLVIMSDYNTGSAYFEPALAALEQARLVPGSSILPEQAALMVAAHSHTTQQRAWWLGLQGKLRTQALSPTNLGALQALNKCQETRECAFAPGDMLATFGAALSRGDDPEVLNIYGSYALNSLGDVPLALRLWQEAVRLRPEQPQYRINLARLLIALDQAGEARIQIAKLRALGRFGQNESAALALDKQLESVTQLRKSRDGR